MLALTALLAAGCAEAPDPADDRFKALPRLCDLISPETVRQVLGEPVEIKTVQVETTGYCLWTFRDLATEGPHPLERVASLHATLHRSTARRFGTAAASEELQRLTQASAQPYEHVEDVGDDAMRRTMPDGADYVIVVHNLNIKLWVVGRDVIDTSGTVVPIPMRQTGSAASRLAGEVVSRADGA
ncbi:hypothetical protein [Saccharopolyspora shandongensis]|uniref:hypothetical protein n=1 Tax=Saccharopolyspora shandongensis TaxID=418495 RepID=UPI000B883F14|nr:hypothetical protein [Saccharopolyspora shandongensis]